MIPNGYRISLWGDKNVLILIVVMVVQLCEHTKNDCIVYFKWVNGKVLESYLNKRFLLKISYWCMFS